MTALSGPKRKYIIIGAAALAIILGLILIYIQFSTLSELRSEVEEEEMAVDAARSDLDRLLTHRDRADQYEERLEYAGRKIPAEPGEEQVLRYIHRLVDKHGLRADDINFEGRVENEGFVTMPLSINLEGSFSDIRKLLDDLRGGERAVRVDDLDFNPAGGPGDLQVSITAHVFYRP